MAPGMYLGCNVLLPGAGSPTEQNGDVGTGNHLYQTVHLMGFGAFTSVELLFVIVFIQLSEPGDCLAAQAYTGS